MADEDQEVSSEPSLTATENSTGISTTVTETSETIPSSSEVTTEASEFTTETSTEASEVYSDAIFAEFDVPEPEVVETQSEEPVEITRDDILRISGRRLKAEDELWAVCPVGYLQEICIKYIADNFIEIGVIKVQKSVNRKQWQKIMELLPLELPYEILLPTLEDETYWKRRCIHSWNSLNIGKKPWRNLFAEMTVQNAMESYIPFVTDPGELRKAKKACKELVNSLTIKKLQLVPMDLDHESEDEDDEIQLPIPYNLPNHMDVGSVLVSFPGLKEVNLCLAPEDCGFDYEFTDYELTVEDVNLLTESLRKIPSLEAFHLSGSHVFNYLVRELCAVVKESSSLKLLELSYAVLDHKCCKSLANLLMSTSPLESLILSYNAIGDEGISFLGAALTENSSLKVLSVKLNGICDKGGEFFAQCLERNHVLESLDISGNFLGEKSGVAFANLIRVSESLKYLNLSSNRMGSVAGVALTAAVENNYVVRECDVRLCDLGQKAETAIRQCILRNCAEKHAWTFD